MSSTKRGILWFKTYLRVLDNPILATCHQESDLVDHVYVIDPRSYRRIETHMQHGEVDVVLKCDFKRFKFLCESLNCLGHSLAEKGGKLHIFLGTPENVLPATCLIT